MKPQHVIKARRGCNKLDRFIDLGQYIWGDGDVRDTLQRAIVIVVLSLFSLAEMSGTAWSQLVNENLLETMPQGFKVGFQAVQNNVLTLEWVPQNETVDNWTEMVTTQIFRGRKDLETGPFLRFIGERWLAACKGSAPNTIHTGKVNGYPVSMLLLHCPMNPTTGKPENTLFRAIKGNDSFYLVQKAFRLDPSAEQLAEAAKYLGTVSVCDTRSADHPCPDLKAQGFKPLTH